MNYFIIYICSKKKNIEINSIKLFNNFSKLKMSGKKIIIRKKGGVICIKESFMQGTKVATKTMFVVEDT